MIFIHLVFPFLLDENTANLLLINSGKSFDEQNSIYLALENLDLQHFQEANLLNAFSGVKHTFYEEYLKKAKYTPDYNWSTSNLPSVT